MIARMLSFSSEGRLSIRNGQLVYDGGDGTHRTFPIDDIGFVIVDTDRMSISSSCLRHLSEANVAFIICDGRHMPTSQLLPFAFHSTAHETITAQLNSTDAVNGRLWRQLIRSKIENQSSILRMAGHEEWKKLHSMADNVRNYDEGCLEAQAARIYFQTLSPSSDFTRERFGIWPNAALNYGYAVLRAAVARSLVGSGLLCIKGIRHHNRYDPLCLADDVMEPYRPFVDQYVFIDKIRLQNGDELTKDDKKHLLKMLTCDVGIGDMKRPLMNAISCTTASLARYYLGSHEHLELPGLQ